MARRRYVYREVEPGKVEAIEVGADFEPTERRAQTATEELTYGNLRATDGTPINTRRRHREYMKQNGLALTSDYEGGYWKKAQAEREKVYSGNAGFDSARRKESIARAIEKVQNRSRRR